jgi:EAL domain-containing protein (putative c-di-GMP-specific phosphodiesterase class I)
MEPESTGEGIRARLPIGHLKSLTLRADSEVMSRTLTPLEPAGRAGRHLLQYLRAVTGTAWSIDSTPLGVAFPVNDAEGLLRAYLCMHDPAETERCTRIGATVAAILTHLQAVEAEFLAPVEHSVTRSDEHHDQAAGDPFGGRMIAHFQPIVDLADGRVVAVEALARMQSGATILGPGAFLELINSPAMMLALFDRMLDCSLAFLAEQRLRAPGLSAAVKLEFAGIPEVGLPELIERRLETWGLPGSALEVELNARAMFVLDAPRIDQLRRLAALGVNLVLADIDQADHLVRQLAGIPLAGAKVGRRYVARLVGHEDEAATVRSLIAAAQRLGLEVIADGVETRMQTEQLLLLGCRFGLGYLFAVPQPPELLAELIDKPLVAVGY